MTAPPERKRGGPDQQARLSDAATTKQQRSPNSPSFACVESGLPSGERAMLRRIRDAARAGTVAPTTEELLELLGCSSYSTPVAALRRLQLRGLIYFESFQRGRRFWLPDGRSTAPVACTEAPWRWRGRRIDGTTTNTAAAVNCDERRSAR
jgi:hypothetical protein